MKYDKKVISLLFRNCIISKSVVCYDNRMRVLTQLILKQC